MDVDTDVRAVLKLPSTDARDDPAARHRLAMEEWVARRVSSPHLLRAATVDRPRTALYSAMERIEGRTLRAWAGDRPAPNLERVRAVVAAIAAAPQAMHRRGLVHRDLRPENVLVDAADHVTVIDFGAVRVEGRDELAPDATIPGTHQYTASEVLLGEPATEAADLYALGAIAHELLSGRLPYRTHRARPPLERHPHRFWQATSLALALAVIALLVGRTP